MRRLPQPAPDTPTLAQLREALSRADPDVTPRWGKMDGAQMLAHCRTFVDLYLGRVPVAWPMRLFARTLGPLFLARTLRKSPTATPRNLSTLPALRIAPDRAREFERERGRLLAALEEVGELRGTVEHPLYGKMAAEDLIALVRHHTAHHANQFGLLETAAAA